MPNAPGPNTLSEEDLLRAAQADLGEDPKQLEDKIRILREWADKSPHLQLINKDDKLLRTFLRGCKFSLERTKEKVDFYFSVRGMVDWFKDWDPRLDHIHTILKAGVYLPLPGYDKEGRFTMIMRNGVIDPNVMKTEDTFKVSTMITELAMRNNPQATIKGIVLIQDMSGMGAIHAKQINPSMAKKAITIWQEGNPIMPKAMHFLNMPSVMVAIFNMFQGLQKEKLRKRNVIHPKGSLEKLHESVGLDVLPKEYGGTNGTLADLTEYWLAEMEANRDWLIQQTKYKTEESKRPGKPKLHSDFFGIEGSFRKLEID